MNQNRTAALAMFFAAVISVAPPRADADSNSPTTISSEDGALTRSAPPVSVSSDMPSGPPALSTAGAPNTPMMVMPRVAPALPAAPASSAPRRPPPAAAPVVIMDARDGEGTVISSVGKGKRAVPGGGVIVDRNGRRIEVVPAAEIPGPIAPKIAPAPALPPVAPTPAAPAPKSEAPQTQSSRNFTWPLVLGLSAAAAALGFALR